MNGVIEMVNRWETAHPLVARLYSVPSNVFRMLLVLHTVNVQDRCS